MTWTYRAGRLDTQERFEGRRIAAGRWGVFEFAHDSNRSFRWRWLKAYFLSSAREAAPFHLQYRPRLGGLILPINTAPLGANLQ